MSVIQFSSFCGAIDGFIDCLNKEPVDSLYELSPAIEKLTNMLILCQSRVEEFKHKHYKDKTGQFLLSFSEKDAMLFQPKSYRDSVKLSMNSIIEEERRKEEEKRREEKRKEEKMRTDKKKTMEVYSPREIVLEEIDGISLHGNKLRLPIAEDLKEITPALYWYEGDKFYKKGIYISLCKGFYTKLAFPNLITGMEKDMKIKTLRCKYKTFEECHANKKKMAELFSSDIKVCNFVHKGEKFNKLGFWARCEVENFGNHNELDHDLDIVDNFDIKHLLLYSLSDDLLAALWYQNKFKNANGLVFTGLDTF